MSNKSKSLRGKPSKFQCRRSQLRGKVIVSSFHSSSVKYIEDCDPEALISLDSHADTVLCGVTGKLMAIAESMPKNLRDAVLRPSTHTLMRRHMPSSRIFVVTPLTCLISATLGEHKLSLEINSDRIIDASTSPPNSLKKLAEEVRGQTTVIDIDVDYMADCQGECYTMAPGLEIKDGKVVRPRKSDLGSPDKVLKLIKLTKPAVITLSEAKLSALRKSDSFTAKFLRMLQGLHYGIEYGALLSSDEEAFDLMDKCEYFVDVKVREIVRKYIGISSDEVRQTKEEEEIADAMKEYFMG
jgi:hypothetical protein